MELPQKAIDRLCNYTYTSNEGSYVIKYLYFICNKIINYIPTWISPNILTLCGLGFVSISTLLLYFYQSAYNYIICAGCLFIYQLFDLLDGLQGRRTNMYTNPTTEIFDHGCDSIIMLLTLFNSVQIFGLTPLMTILLAVPIMTDFYFSTWEHLHTHVMQFRAGIGNPEESLLVTEMMYLLVYFYPELRENYVLRSSIIGSIFGMAMIYMYFSWRQTVHGTEKLDRAQKYMRNITLLPLGLNVLLAFWAYLFIDNPLALLMTFGVPWVYSIFKLIWAEITGLRLDIASNVFMHLIAFASTSYSLFLTIPVYMLSFSRGVTTVCRYLDMKYWWTIPPLPDQPPK